jgi:hypothetical protein
VTPVNGVHGRRDAKGVRDGEPHAHEVVDVVPDDRLASALEVGQRLRPAVGLAHADATILPDQLDHRPQRIGRMQPV